MYGVHTTSAGLQKFAANRLKELLHSLTKKRLVAVIVGIVMTVAFQSSAATTVLVVEFVNAGMINLAQALGIVLGSAVGTSISIQLIAFRMLDVALGIIFIGFILFLLLKEDHWKHLGQAMIGFGIIFVGMANMSGATAPLTNIPEVYTHLAQLGKYPLLGILVGLLLTALLQSSTAVFAIMMSLAGQHLLTMDAIVPLVLGAHIGGTITTLISSLTAQKMDAKRTAIANTGYKVLGTILVYPFMVHYANLITWTTSDLHRQVANAHLIFALFMVIVFLPFNTLIAKGLVRALPERKRAASELRFKHIDESSLEIPAVALTQAFQEIWGTGQLILKDMIRVMPEVVSSKVSSNQIKGAYRQVHWYYQHIFGFLTDLSKRGLTTEQIEDNIKAQFILKEIHYIADSCLEITTIAEKLVREEREILFDRWNSVSELYQRVMENYSELLEALKNWDPDRAAQVIREHPEITRVQRSLQFAFLAEAPRLQQGPNLEKSEENSVYSEIDLLNLLYHIESHARNVAQVIMGLI